MIEQGRPVTPMTLLYDVTQESEISGGKSTSEFLAELAEVAPPSPTAPYLAKQILDLSQKRTLKGIGEYLVDLASNAPATLSAMEIRGRLETGLDKTFRTLGEVGIRSMGEVGDEVLKVISVAHKRGRAYGERLGLAAIEDLLGPALGGRLYMLGGPSGSGKTALVVQLGLHIATPHPDMGDPDPEPKPVLMFSTEMRDREIISRILGGATNIKPSKLDRATVDAGEFERLWNANEEGRRVPFYVDSSTHQTADTIRMKAKRMKRTKGLAAILIDHLINIEGTDRFKKEHEVIRDNLMAMKGLAMDLDVPLFLLSQLIAEYNKGPVRRPTIGDLYNTAAVEQWADGVLLLWREEYILARREPSKNPTTDKERAERTAWEAAYYPSRGKAEAILGKFRGDEGTGIRQLWWDGPRVRFSDSKPPMDLSAVIRDERDFQTLLEQEEPLGPPRQWNE